MQLYCPPLCIAPIQCCSLNVYLHTTGLIAICSGSACIAVEFYRPAVTMMMHYYVDILEFDIFTPHTLEIEIARFAEVVWKAYLPDLSMD